MIKQNFTYAVIIIICLVIAIASFISMKFTNNPEAPFWFERSLWVSQIAGSIMLLVNGSFMRGKYFKFFLIGIPVALIGASLKIMHWPYGNLTLILGLLLTTGIYIFHFFKKKEKKILDVLKVIWVLSYYILGISVMMHLISHDFKIVTPILMWITIIFYMVQEARKGQLFD